LQWFIHNWYNDQQYEALLEDGFMNSRVSCLARLLACAAILLSTVAHFVQAGTVRASWTFAPSDVRLERMAEYTQISIPDGVQPQDAPGVPSLPAKCVYVIIPAGASISDMKITASETPIGCDVLIYPVQPSRSTNDPPCAFVAPDAAAYASAEKMPALSGTVQGTQQLHGYTLVAVRLNPLRYIPSQRTLFLATRIDAVITYREKVAIQGLQPTADLYQQRREEVKAVVSNPQDVDCFTRSSTSYDTMPAMGLLEAPSSDSSAVYLLITSNSLASAFQPLVDRRTLQGKQGKLVTVEDVNSMYDGTRPDGDTDLQTKIRNCIIDHYQNHGTVWVCLAGDNTIIPLRYVYSDLPTDMYYACLDGSYDEDADGQYGEVADDNADLLPEVWIGRIPVQTAEQAAAYVGKVSLYEAAHVDDFSHSMLIGSSLDWFMSGNNRPMFPYYWDHDPVDEGEWPMREVYRKIIQPSWQATPLGQLFNSYSTWDDERCGDYNMTYDHMVEQLNRGYHHVYLWGHGNAVYGAGLDRSMAGVLTNSSRPSIFFVTSCTTAAIDYEDPSQSEAMIRCPTGGGVAYIGACRSEASLSYTAEAFYKEVFANKRATLGEAFARSKMVYAAWSAGDGYYRDNQWILNLHGDPAISFTPEPVTRSLQMLSPKGCEEIDAAFDIYVRWNASGTSFAGGELVKLDYSSDGGSSWVPIPGAEGLPYDGRVFVWENPALATGSQYRIRVTSLTDPAVSATSGRDFSVGPMRTLLVQSSIPGVAISGTYGNNTAQNGNYYTYGVFLDKTVSLTATSVAGYNFVRWASANGATITHSNNIVFPMSGNKTVIACFHGIITSMMRSLKALSLPVTTTMTASLQRHQCVTFSR
jgi:hypothetical protein